MPMTALDDKINEHFAGLVVRKDLVKDGQGQRHRAVLRAGVPARPVLRHQR